MMDCGMSVVKFFVFIFNLIFALGGIALMIFGGLVIYRLNYINPSMDEINVTVPAIVLIVIGSIVFIIAFLGCCGAAKENRCMLISYAMVLSVIFFVEMAVGALAFVHYDEAEKAIDITVKELFHRYGYNVDNNAIVDDLQSTIQCCGVDGPSYWILQSPLKPLPSSCCEGNPSLCINPYKSGCLNIIHELIKFSVTILGGIALGIAVIELLGILLSFCLANAIKNERLKTGYYPMTTPQSI